MKKHPTTLGKALKRLLFPSILVDSKKNMGVTS
jgi:hypothetical protein